VSLFYTPSTVTARVRAVRSLFDQAEKLAPSAARRATVGEWLDDVEGWFDETLSSLSVNTVETANVFGQQLVKDIRGAGGTASWPFDDRPWWLVPLVLVILGGVAWNLSKGAGHGR